MLPGTRVTPFGRGPLAARPTRCSRLQCRCQAPSDGSGSSRTPLERIKRALLGSGSSNVSPSESESHAHHGGSASNGRFAASLHPSSQSKEELSLVGDNTTSALPSSSSSLGQNQVEEDSWSWWTEYFDSLDDTVRELEGIDDDLEAAVRVEDYGKAAHLRDQQRVLESSNPLKNAFSDLREALEQERYADAATLRDAAGVRLLGWWAGRMGENDSEGHLVAITADFGRYIAYAFTGNQIGEIVEKKSDGGNISVLGSMDSIDGGASPNLFGGNFADNGPKPPFSIDSGDASDSEGIVESDFSELGPSSSNLDEYGVPVFEVFLRHKGDDAASKDYIQKASVLHAPAAAFTPNGIMSDLSSLLTPHVEGGASISVEKGQGEDGVDFVTIKITGGEGDLESVGVDIQSVDDVENKATDVEDDGEEDTASTSAESSDTQGDGEQESVADASVDPSHGSQNSRGESNANDSVIDITDEVREMSAEISHGNDAGSMADALAQLGQSKNDDMFSVSDGSGSEETTLSSMGIGFVAQRVPARLEWDSKNRFNLVVPSSGDRETNERIKDDEMNGSADLIDIVGDTNKDSRGVSGQQDAFASTSERDEGSSVAAGDDRLPSRNAEKSDDVKINEIEDLVRKAMGQAIAKGIGATDLEDLISGKGSMDVVGLQGEVNYSRVSTDGMVSTDPLSGIFVGSFGPHGHEVVKLERAMIDGEEWVQVRGEILLFCSSLGIGKREGGNSFRLTVILCFRSKEKLKWLVLINCTMIQVCYDDIAISNMMAQSNCGHCLLVQALKLTGDVNVPAGQVCFRAKIERTSRLNPSEYPPELGTLQRYQGQGLVAKEGFRMPSWVDGELLVLSPKGPVTRGAELGLMYNMTSLRGKEHYLVLFKKVDLEEFIQCATQLQDSLSR